jgi:putative transposase
VAEPLERATRATSGDESNLGSDFIHDSLNNVRRFRAFAVFDQWSRESVAPEVDLPTGERVTMVLEQLRTERGLPLVTQAYNGPELRGRTIDQPTYERGVGCDSSNPANRSRTRISRVSIHGCAKNI